VPDESNPLANMVAELAPSLGPVLRDSLVPALRADTAMQDRIGAAIGRELAATYRTQVNVATAALTASAIALAAIAAALIYDLITEGD